ncbi:MULTISPECIES: zinc-dependent alcohol dehydrogenase [unclassified Planococcus (in: firmicutes)]|uniref:zinc-dependent alcohol dehydrogenase n=1 Tax=unclassified Planococcus (in: firmicutes) TaxID=2662419 RepID=UPI000C33A34E|nr:MULTISPECIES: zinc-dependent alcohol dehydrogenase [unclassified Planococcus (in: firmicutes)]AUD13831.1 glutathione-dependent formaldehyde dehydrogenase [Planococcus sp. MB-3u-03]PKG45667.1 glutathione-dependent formaldehyde dehydrogenase [Planococcus sp. Urea-trap-24]PKG88623.1 glutathione-dependent formaldehyde dehydrogenase [Planococcus sp. Urea-3u-39]PKH38658.1 glutathione-dependent formaldehyde dehydrogenase [Planococcus sp. MB-3u-09]
MKAVTFQGVKDMKVKNVKDPELEKKDDIIVKITSTAICGSDLHIYQGALPARKDYVIGHEPMGIVEEVGPEVTKVKKGDRIVLPFNVSCGQCFYCNHDLESQCDNSNGNPHFDTGGYFGFTERYGSYSGGQAEYLRVPYGNFMPYVIPESSELEDESLLFLSDVLPTAWWSVENAGVKQGDTVVVLGCGPIGLMTQKFAWMKGAKRVIAVDEVPYRMNLAKKMNNVEVFDFNQYDNMGAYIHEITSGGARVVIDCVGMDGKKSTAEAVQQKLKLQGGTLSAIDIAKDAVSKFGVIQLTGIYGLTYNMFPLGNIFERNVTMKMGQAPVIHLMPMLYEKIENGEFDPREIISHIMPLEKASDAYKIFNDHTDDCTKVILKP